jgi:hypothetical protein
MLSVVIPTVTTSIKILNVVMVNVVVLNVVAPNFFLESYCYNSSANSGYYAGM